MKGKTDESVLVLIIELCRVLWRFLRFVEEGRERQMRAYLCEQRVAVCLTWSETRPAVWPFCLYQP